MHGFSDGNFCVSVLSVTLYSVRRNTKPNTGFRLLLNLTVKENRTLYITTPLLASRINVVYDL